MIYVVSGLPRSGTSMMMKMLEAGGLPVLIDADNLSSEAHPSGAYEYGDAKRISKGRDAFLKKCDGFAVKVIAPSVCNLPSEYQYKIVFMERNLSEVFESQKKIMNGAMMMGDENILSSALFIVKRWISAQEKISTLWVDYNKLLAAPLENCREIAAFLGLELNITKMSKVPKQKFYRNRTS